MNSDGIDPIVAESAYVLRLDEGIYRMQDECRVVRFTLFRAHDSIIHPIGNIITWHLNEREGDPTIAARQRHDRYRAAIWNGTDFERPGRPDARFVSVLDRWQPDPEHAMLTMTRFGTDRIENAAILRSATVAAESLNLERFDWTPAA